MGRGRRLLVTAGFVVLAVVVIAVVATRWLIDDRAETIPTDEVIANYRSSTSVAGTEPSDDTSAHDAPVVATAGGTTDDSVAGPAPDPLSSTPATVATPTSMPAPEAVAVPVPGVYRYATEGFEQIDALGGARHDYPAETTITVTPAGCGVRVRWDVLRERRDEWAICGTPDGVELQPDGLQYHEFFQQPDEETVTCSSTVLMVPAEPAATPTTEQNCRLGDDPWNPSWAVLERGTRSVDGTEVAITHVRMTVSDDDAHWEHTTIDWFLASDGLPVAVTGVKESSSPSPIGDVMYTEQFHLELVSLAPAT